MATNYANVADNRYREAVTTEKGYFVIHDSESGDDTFDSLMRFLTVPGTNTNNGGLSFFGSSYNALTNGLGAGDPSRGYEWVLGEDAAPFAAPPLNDYGLHICMPGKAGQSRDEWTDALSMHHIEGVAQFILDNTKKFNIPLRRVTANAMKMAGITGKAVGYCGHSDVRDAWGKTNHFDPGGNFPWDILSNLLQVPVDPPKPITRFDYPEGYGMRRFIFKWETQTAVMICHTDLITYWTSFKNAEQYYTAVMHPDFLQDMRGQPDGSLGIPFILHKTAWAQLPEKQMGDATLL